MIKIINVVMVCPCPAAGTAPGAAEIAHTVTMLLGMTSLLHLEDG